MPLTSSCDLDVEVNNEINSSCCFVTVDIVVVIVFLNVCYDFCLFHI